MCNQVSFLRSRSLKGFVFPSSFWSLCNHASANVAFLAFSVRVCERLQRGFDSLSQPPTVACKMEAQSEYVHVAHTFFARLVPICLLSRCLLTKFLHRSSGGSLLRVRCWLGSCLFFFSPSLLRLHFFQLRVHSGMKSTLEVKKFCYHHHHQKNRVF